MYTLTTKHLFIILLLLFLGCTEEEEVKVKVKLKNIFVSNGVACWYGPGFEGKKTSSGEIFRKNKLTAAHRFLEFGTLILVTNQQNQKSVVVEVNDRGPFSKGKILDLSEKAAREIDLLKKGFGNVNIEIYGYERINFNTLLKHRRNIVNIHNKKINK